MRVCKLTSGGSFDLLNSENETNTTLVRNANMVRVTYSDNSGLTQLVKNDVATADIGTLLVTDGAYLKPTGDKKGVAKLLAPISEAVQTRSVSVNGQTRNLYLLPVQLL